MNTNPKNFNKKILPPIITLPDSRLKIKSHYITNFEDKAVQETVKSLLSILTDSPFHSVGIAAPQIGEFIRLIVVDARKSKRPCTNHGLLILANPEIVQQEGRIVFREGCMSVPGFHAYIERYNKIKVNTYDLSTSSYRQIDAEGFEAVVLQHEIDHLDGILFIDRKIVRM